MNCMIGNINRNVYNALDYMKQSLENLTKKLVKMQEEKIKNKINRLVNEIKGMNNCCEKLNFNMDNLK